jgi:hypothetical protein
MMVYEARMTQTATRVGCWPGRRHLLSGAVDPGVRELRAEATLTFRHRDTGKIQTNVFTTTMLKRERTKLGPLE